MTELSERQAFGQVDQSNVNRISRFRESLSGVRSTGPGGQLKQGSGRFSHGQLKQGTGRFSHASGQETGEH